MENLVERDRGLMYCFSKSMGRQLRLYPSEAAMNMESAIDQELASSARIVFLSALLSCGKDALLGQVDSIFADLLEFTFPLYKLYIQKKYNINDTKKEIEKVDAFITKYDEILAGKPYLCDNQLTAADIALCSHMMFVLFPCDGDWFHDSGKPIMPPLSKLPNTLKPHVTRWRSSRLGMYIYVLLYIY